MGRKINNNFFWFFIVPILVFLTLYISLSPWLAELIATPVTQVFSGINRWSVDYFIYLSYVEIGRRGQIPALLLQTTVSQQPVWTHFIYTVPGFIFGKILGLNAIFIYHFIRSFYGVIFLFLCIYFFYRITKNKIITLFSFIFTFYVSGFSSLRWIQEQNIITRATGPSHYTLGMVTFMLTVLWYFYSHTSFIKKALVMGILLNLILLTNPFAFIVISISFALYFVINLIKVIKFKRDFIIVVIAFLLTIPYLLYLRHALSLPPWGTTGMSPKFYVVLHPPLYLKEIVLSIGPTFFLALLGIIGIILDKIKTRLDKNLIKFLIVWVISQFFLLFCGDYLKIDPIRSFNSLYFIPLSLFSAIFLSSLFKNQIINTIILIFIFLLTLPNYITSYHDQLYAFTDFKSFQPLSYPYKNQVAAFTFLEKNTDVGSGVLAMYEVSSLVMGFSGNSAGAGIDHNIKTRFYSNAMGENEAYYFLKTNRFQYVYYGYQEKYAGGNLNKYPFLKKIFSNEEVSIYKIL